MADKKIKNVIFDVGGVLVDFRWPDHIREIGIPEDMFERVADATVRSGVWSEIDRGSVPLEELIDCCVAKDPEIEREIRLFFEDRGALVKEKPYAAGWFDTLRANGYKTYFLSNYGKDHFEAIRNKFTFFGKQDGEVVSYQVHYLKPEDAIYRTIIDKYNLVPEECVFIDDIEDNVEGARRAGMKGIRFESYEQALDDLKKLGVECK